VSFRKLVRACREDTAVKQGYDGQAGFDFLAFIDVKLAERAAKNDGCYYMAFWHPLHDPLKLATLADEGRAGVQKLIQRHDVFDLAEALRARTAGHNHLIDIEDLERVEMPEGVRTQVYLVRRGVAHACWRFLELMCVPGTCFRIRYWGMHHGKRVEARLVTLRPGCENVGDIQPADRPRARRAR
jgi:hypothetical protein